MDSNQQVIKKTAFFGIALLCFGYFASYVPFSMMTKMVTKGLFEGMPRRFTGFEIQPMSIIAGLVAMYIFITVNGWWKHATHSRLFGISFPRPRLITFLSGLCTAGQIITTILAYTFDGISIVFAMLLMRGGVLAMAPIIDLLATRRKRAIYWPSWIAAGLSLGALFVAFMGKAGTAMTLVAAVDIGIYLLGYFIKLFLMSNYAKSEDLSERVGYFAEEQIVAMPSLLLVLFIVGLFGSTMTADTIPAQVWWGFTELPKTGFLWHVMIMGIFSTCTGLFGTMIYLDKRENTFTVPANRSSSIIAGVIATTTLAVVYGQRFPSMHQMIGVALILGAIFFLSYRSIVEKRQKKLNQ